MHKLDRILAAEGALQPLLAKTRELEALAALLGGFLPPELAAEARVANYREGELVLAAGNAAVAAKLRLLTPSLRRFFENQRWQVRSVAVRVQPNASQSGVVAALQKTAYLSTDTLDSLKSLYERMNDSPARAALGRLLARRGAKPVAAPRPRTAEAQMPGRKRRI